MSAELVETSLPILPPVASVVNFTPPLSSVPTTATSTATTNTSTTINTTAALTAERANEGPSSPTTVREIHKNGWLKKFPSTDRRAIPFAKLPKPEKMWVVFCIHDDVDAFLEYYENRRSAFSHRPTSSVPLTQCLHISSNIVYQDNDFVFSITLESHVIKLAATSREQMIEWMDTLKGKLTELGHLQPHYNVYTRLPETRPPLAPVRDPSSPLPPTPGIVSPVTNLAPSRRITPPARSSEPSSPTSPFASFMSLTYSESNIVSRLATTTLQSGVSNHSLAPQVLGNAVNPMLHSPRPLHTVPSPNSTMSPSNYNTTLSYVRHLPVTPPSLPCREDSERDLTGPSGSTHFTFDVAVSLTTSNTALPAISSATCNISRNVPVNHSMNSTASAAGVASASSTSVTVPPSPGGSSNHGLMTTRVASRDYVYEPLFLASSADRAMSNSIRNPNYGGPPRRAPCAADSNIDTSTGLSRTRVRSQSEDRSAVAVAGTISNGFNVQLSSGGLNIHCENNNEENHRFLTLREKQVIRLCQEIQHKGGVRILLPHKDCVNSIAFAECFGSVWITGWKQREHPLLYHSFHIGDRVISIGGRNVTSAHCAHRIMKSELSSRIEFVVGRLPFGQAFAIKRDFDGQDLGLVRAGNTAEIIEVLEGGLASRHGLPAKASSCEGESTCNWMLTEVSGRPLNLFFKDNEVHDRLNAVGNDISILVQPSDFVKALKKQLKSIRNYKEYIVQ